MKLNCLAVTAMLLLCLSTFAQTTNLQKLNSNFENKRRCFAAEHLANFIKNTPNAETIDHFEGWIKEKVAERKAMRIGTENVNPPVVLPIVFHIIHNNEAVGTGRNIPQEFVRQQVMQLNKDFANLSGSPYAVAQDMGIQFALAQKDPNGNILAEPGIDRINRSSKSWSAPPYTVGYTSTANDYLNNTIKPASIWDPERYINIWVSEWEAGVLGIATFPVSSGLAGLFVGETNSNAGVAIGYETLGSTMKPSVCGGRFVLGRTLTHELGHFMGLRHIWGDDDCGTDYCGDTPTHFEDNSGVPVHPKSNSCGTADEMFENYMDYSDDIVLNTFTVDQGLRMEAVMNNSPRRKKLATSNVGLVSVGSNELVFSGCALSVSEQVATNNCATKYKDILVPLHVDGKATATTTVNITTGGTAVSGRDYTLLTPTITFNTDDVYQEIGIRIFDNSIVDGTRNITLGYSIGAGGGVVTSSTNNTFTLPILDDEINIDIDEINVENATLMNQSFGTTTGSNQLPSGWSTAGSSGNNKWVVNSAGNTTYGFSGNTAHISSGNTAQVNNGSASIGYSGTSTSDARLFTSSVNTSNLKNVTLSFDYVCRGEVWGGPVDFGIVYYSTNGSDYSILTNPTTNQPYIFINQNTKATFSTVLPKDAWNKANVSLLFRWLNDNSVANTPPFVVDNIVISGKRQKIESEIGESNAIRIMAGTNNNHFYSDIDGDIIASLSGLSEDIGCITASAVNTGSGKIAVTNHIGSGERAEKVISITPSVANSTASYDLTLYFTVADLAAWGTEISDLQLAKLPNGVYSSNSYNASNCTILPTTFADHSDKGYYTYTATVTGGFSDFILTNLDDQPLPITLLSFTAAAHQRSIQLNWATSQEFNNKGFEIERSIDGEHFEVISWMEGAILSSQQIDYAYNDRDVQPGVRYFYRLHQIDLDGKATYTEQRSAQIEGTGFKIMVSPNPAKDYIHVFLSGADKPANITLVNAQGQQVRNWRQINASTRTQQLDIRGLASGTYFLIVQLPDTKETVKLVIP